jgi:hypothetical protein
VAEQQKLHILSAAERAIEARRLVMPNPGDVIMAMVFGWAVFCLVVFTGGRGMLMQVARLSRVRSVQEVILNVDAASMIFVIVLGALMLVALVVLCYSYRYITFGLLVFGANFGNASWKPLHDVAFIFKNLGVLFFASYAGMFLLKNFWRMVATPYVRMMLAYFLWVAAICVLLGGQTGDLWYMGTDLALVIGLGAGWWNHVETTEDLNKFNMTLLWVAIPTVLITATAPVLSANHIEGGRFMGFASRATGFGTTFAPMLLCVFWKLMSEKRVVQRNLLMAVAVLGVALLLWSGTRSGILGMGLGLFIMWRVFKTRIFAYSLIGLAFLGLTALIIGFEGSEDMSKNLERMDVTENVGRLELWVEQWPVFAASPVYGVSPSGRNEFGKSEALVNFLGRYGVTQKAFAPHNSYLGMAIKFGGVGLILLICLMAKPMLRAKKVVFSEKVPYEERAVFCLPAALSVLIGFEVFFEDTLSAQGKGTILGVIFSSLLFLLDKVGKNLEKKYLLGEVSASQNAAIPQSKLVGSGNP